MNEEICPVESFMSADFGDASMQSDYEGVSSYRNDTTSLKYCQVVPAILKIPQTVRAWNDSIRGVNVAFVDGVIVGELDLLTLHISFGGHIKSIAFEVGLCMSCYEVGSLGVVRYTFAGSAFPAQ